MILLSSAFAFSHSRVPTMPQFQQAATVIFPNPLEHALDQNEAIQESVEQSAAELCVVSAVLSREIPDDVKTGEVVQAIQRTEELEDRIQTLADDLAKVNQTLKSEISARANLERQLAAAQAELSRVRAQPQSQSAAHLPAQSFLSSELASL